MEGLCKDLRRPSPFYLYEENGPGYRALLRQHVLGLVRLDECYPMSAGCRRSVWEDNSPWKWCIGAALALPVALPARGAQGFWRAPDALVETIRAQLVELTEQR